MKCRSNGDSKQWAPECNGVTQDRFSCTELKWSCDGISIKVEALDTDLFEKKITDKQALNPAGTINQQVVKHCG